MDIMTDDDLSYTEPWSADVVSLLCATVNRPVSEVMVLGYTLSPYSVCVTCSIVGQGLGRIEIEHYSMHASLQRYM